MKTLSFLTGLAPAALVVSVAFSPSLAKADASAWNEDLHSAVRLIGARAQAGAPLRAGIEMRLAPGWKTYWRYPGDSGVPPRFDFSASRNVKNVTVLWPAPVRFKEGDGTAIGYSAGVTFPLQVEPIDARAPVSLAVKLDYGVCEKLCVPATGEATLPLPAKSPAHEAALAAAERMVPKAIPLGAEGPLAIAAVRLEAGERPRVIVDVRAPGAVDLFVEGPAPDWALPVPEPVSPAPAGLRRFAFEIDGLPSGATIKGARLLLTLVTPTVAIETAAHLD